MTDNLSELYRKKTTFGNIKLTDEGLDIDGQLIKNFNHESISVVRIGGKTIVKCELICDKFISIPK